MINKTFLCVSIFLILMVIFGCRFCGSESFAVTKNVSNPSIFQTPRINVTTKLADFDLEFSRNRPFQETQNYNKSFDDIKIENPPFKTYEDQLFSNIIGFENDPFPNGKIGLEKCMEQCNGECVEYGMTGIAHCFVNDGQVMKSTFYEQLRQDNNYKTEAVDKKPEQQIYANMR